MPLKFLDALYSAAKQNDKDEKKEPETLTWDEFVKKTGKEIDKRLIAHARKEGLIYIGGKCRFTATASDEKKEAFVLNVDAELYYKDQFRAENNIQIYPLHTERSFSEFKTDDEATKAQLEQLKTEQIEFNVDTPQIKVKNEKE